MAGRLIRRLQVYFSPLAPTVLESGVPKVDLKHQVNDSFDPSSLEIGAKGQPPKGR